MATANDKPVQLLTKPEQDLIVAGLDGLLKSQERKATAAHNSLDKDLQEVYEKKIQTTQQLIYKLRQHNLGFQ